MLQLYFYLFFIFSLAFVCTEKKGEALLGNNIEKTSMFELAQECSSITEIGGKSLVSIRQLLSEDINTKGKLKYLSIDTDFPVENDWDHIKHLAKKKNIDFYFWRVEETCIEIELTDLLILNSIKTYHHLTYELKTFSKNVAKYICISNMYENGSPIEKEELYQGDYTEYPFNPDKNSKKNPWEAVFDFLAIHPEWVLKKNNTSQNFLILERIENFLSFEIVLDSQIDHFLKNKIILCTGPSLNAHDRLKETVESELQLISYKNIFLTTNDSSIMNITFFDKKPICQKIKERGHEIDCMNCIITSLKNAVNHPETKDDDIIVFKHESVFLNDLGLFKRAVNVILAGFDMVVRGLAYGAGTDVFLVRVSAIKEVINDFDEMNQFPDQMFAELMLHKLILPFIPNIYTVSVSEFPISNPSNFSHWKHTCLGFYHRYRHKTYSTLETDCIGLKWWDKKNYHELFNLDLFNQKVCNNTYQSRDQFIADVIKAVLINEKKQKELLK